MSPGTIPQSQGVQHHRTSGRGLGAWPAGSPSWAEGPWWAMTLAQYELAAQAVPQASTPAHSQAHRDAFAEGKWENHVTCKQDPMDWQQFAAFKPEL